MDGITLKVLADYRCREVVYSAGTLITVAADEAARLQADSPGSFEVYVPETPKARRNTQAHVVLEK